MNEYDDKQFKVDEPEGTFWSICSTKTFLAINCKRIHYAPSVWNKTIQQEASKPSLCINRAFPYYLIDLFKPLIIIILNKS